MNQVLQRIERNNKNNCFLEYFLFLKIMKKETSKFFDFFSFPSHIRKIIVKIKEENNQQNGEFFEKKEQGEKALIYLRIRNTALIAICCFRSNLHQRIEEGNGMVVSFFVEVHSSSLAYSTKGTSLRPSPPVICPS